MSNEELIAYLRKASQMKTLSRKMRCALGTAAERIAQQDYAIDRLIRLRDCSNCRMDDVQPKPDECNICINTPSGPSHWRPKEGKIYDHQN